MKACGIICEFNPLHNGHKYLIDSVRSSLAPDAVVCVMSGDFVQRGMPALLDKHERARAALECGADLVLELPAYFAVNGASEFAEGGIRILKGLGCIDTLAFGMESERAEDLLQRAKALLAEEAALDQEIGDFLARGLSYPAALQKAAEACGLQIPGSPNDILALEYIKSSLRNEAGFSFFGVKRQGTGHHDSHASEGFASASYIREGLSQGSLSLEALAQLMPERSLSVLKSSPVSDAFALDRYFSMIRFAGLARGPESLAEAPEMGEGLEHRLKEGLQRAKTLDELILFMKSRRYTYSRISRILCQLVLGLTKDGYRKIKDEGQAYAKVLAFNEAGAKVLSACKKEGSIPVLSNVNKLPADFAAEELLTADLKAADLYSVICGRQVYEASDRVRVPVLHKTGL